MSYKVLEQNGVDNENIDGGAFNHFAAGGRDGIIKGVLSECALTTVGNGVGIAPGLIVICGIRVKIIETEALFLSGTPMTATRYQIIVQANLQSNRNLTVNFLLRPVSELRQDALYAAEQGVYEAEIGRFTHLTSGTIEDMVRTLDIISGGTSVDGANEINIGNVTTQTLAPGMDAEVDVENRYDAEQNKFVTDFTFSIPQGEDGKGTLYNEDGDSTVNGFTQAAVKGIAQAKNFYNLGAFDTYVSNGDGTGTVTRKTGFAFVGNTEGAFVWEGIPYLQGIPISNVPHGARIKATIKTANLVTNYVEEPDYSCNDFYGVANENWLRVKVPSATTTEQFREYIAQHPFYIQYELADSYTEKVVENQPIRPANQDEEYYWHGEWRKALNLFNNHQMIGTYTYNCVALIDYPTGRLYIASTTNNNVTKYAYLELDLNSNTVYTFTVSGTNYYFNSARIYRIVENGGEEIAPGIYGIQVADTRTVVTITTDSGSRYALLLYLDSTTTSSNYSYVDLMLVRGSHPYPYEPYNGEIVREKDLSGIQLFPDDVNPAQIIGGDWDDLGEITTSTGVLLHVYRRM